MNGQGDMENLDNRIAVQKRIYLLQAVGLHLGYVFTWDLYGPFSKALARDTSTYEEYRDELDKVARQVEWTESAAAKIEQARQLAEPHKLEGDKAIPLVRWLELVSTLHYLANVNFRNIAWQDADFGQLKRSLLGKKPHFSEYESFVEKAWQRLQEVLPKQS
jgi:uncharacterized protein YwgA